MAMDDGRILVMPDYEVEDIPKLHDLKFRYEFRRLLQMHDRLVHKAIDPSKRPRVEKMLSEYLPAFGDECNSRHGSGESCKKGGCRG